MPQEDSGHIIIGTAGHVDHGKTTLIRALTGIDTDRLKEEKERGMTIDLGFASFTLPGGRKVGIVDVPGHERFLKNMLAGATGVDVVLLVIAADEGVMPQTREHLEILELLEAGKGVVALTKSDMVEEDWLALVEDDVRAALKSTFLRNAPVVRVSGTTGAGVKELADVLAALVADTQAKSSSGPFRLPVDRVFTMTGFGTVVTGTLVSGVIRVGDAVRVLPQGIETRVRQIQVHGAKEQEAQAGTRVAVNLAGVEMTDVERGCVLVPPGYLAASPRIDAFIRMLPDAPKPLKSRARVRLHIGTAEHIGRLNVLGAGEIPAGAEGYIQFISETPTVAARGDKFVLRSYSPMRTIGGGTVLDPNPPKHRPSDRRVIDTLETRRKGEPSDLLEDALLIAPGPVALKDAAVRVGVSEQEAKTLVDGLGEAGKTILLEGNRVIHSVVFSALASRIAGALEEYHRSNPLKAGMPKEELRASLGRGMDLKSFVAVLGEMERLGQVTASENTVRLPGHEVRLTDDQKRAADAIERVYRESGFNAPTSEEGMAQGGPNARNVFQYLVESGALVKIDEGLFLHRETVAQAEATLRKHLSDGGKITVSEFRNLTGSSRKYVVPLLEYFDTKRITRRIGDERVLMSRQ
jgi:selenocysteine-specific elongation factor